MADLHDLHHALHFLHGRVAPLPHVLDSLGADNVGALFKIQDHLLAGLQGPHPAFLRLNVGELEANFSVARASS